MNRTTQPQPSTNSVNYKSWREGFVTAILRIASILGIAVLAIVFPNAAIASRIFFVVLYVILLAITVAPVKYSVRALILLSTIFAIGVYSMLTLNPFGGSIFFIAFITLAALLFDQRIDIVSMAMGILALAAAAILNYFGVLRYGTQASAAPAQWAGYGIVFTATSVALIIAINQFKKEYADAAKGMQNTFQTLANEREQWENRFLERTSDLELRDTQTHSAALISKALTEMQDIPDLVELTARLISDQIGYYHAGLYLLDERHKNAFLQASSSAAGKQLIGQGFPIEPDRLNPFNQVVQQNRPCLVSDAENANFVRDINFPLTRSRMILPLTIRNDVIGILDVHSEQLQSFTLRDVEMIQPLADLVAVSIDNIRLMNQTRNLARQLEASSSAQIRQTWTKLTSRRKSSYQYTPAGVRPIFTGNRSDQTGGLLVPLVLHGQNIGQITLKRKSAAPWSERERILVEKVATQVTLALENSRLVDETQKSALRDKVIANTSARVRQTLDVESVLRTAATELRRVFDLKEAEISIGTDQVENAIPSEKA
ncbi:MAG: GAF domain-containing protein [Chloroflexi bacterium]|nr:GAF domain-containing protein [Chloroflexota bacterium]